MKKPRDGAKFVTLSELADTVPCSPAQARSILVLDTAGRALAPRQHGETRRYSAVDVALVRLVVRLRAQGVSPTVARVLAATYREQLAEIWRARDPMVLAVIGLRGLLLWRGKVPDGAVACVDLRDVWRGVEAAVRAIRVAAPTVRQWNRDIELSGEESGRRG